MLWPGAKANRAFSTLSVATSLLVLLFAPAHTLADVRVVTPLDEQYPSVAHTKESFTWTFSEATFNSTTNVALSYSSSDLPGWVTFDNTTRTFSGTPDEDDDYGTTKVTITASDGSRSSAQSSFGLLVTSDPAPILRYSLVSQLPQASSLGKSQILSGTKLHIPYGWSFSVGWQGSTFFLPSGNAVYTYGTINGLQILPSWLHYSSDTYAMWGVAPDSPPPEGSQFVFVLSGANADGYAGTQTELTIVLGEGKLSVSSNDTEGVTALQTVNATVGIELNYTIPTNLISIDGQEVRNPDALNFTADTSSAGSWLSFDTTTNTLSGMPPSDVIMGSSEPTDLSIPITVEDSIGKKLTFSLPLAIYPAVFSNETLPNIYVEAGQAFAASLSAYIRNSEQANITASYDPTNATLWMTYNADSLVLAGTPPTDFSASSKVTVTLTNNAPSEGNREGGISRRDTASNQASFYVALNGTDAGSPIPTSSSIPIGDGTGPAESRRKRVIIGAVIGTLVGLLLLLLLVVCFLRRRRRSEEARPAGSSIATKSPALSDERTLRDENSPGLLASPFKKLMKSKTGGSPATLHATSPYLHADAQSVYAEKYAIPNGGELRGILVTSDRYARQSGEPPSAAATGPYDEDVYGHTHEEGPEKPQQHGMMAALVPGAKRADWPRPVTANGKETRVAESNSLVRSESAGLGLMGVNMEGSGSGGSSEDNPYRRRSAHARSRMSLRSSVSRESWENDLFYEESARDSRTAAAGSFDANPRPRVKSVKALSAITEDDEIPRRRGDARVSSRHNHVRHRSAHVKTSPNFAAAAVFAGPASDESSGHDRSYVGEQLVKITRTGDVDQAQYGHSDKFVIGTAQRVDVRDLSRNGSVTSRVPQLTHSHERSQSMHADAHCSPSGAFDNADETPSLPKGFQSATNAPANRNSAFSTMTTDSNMIALSPYISYPEPEGRDDAMSASVYSPRPPSFFGGSSIASNVRPEDTLRAVEYSQKGGPPSPCFPPLPAALGQASLRPTNRHERAAGPPPAPPPPRPQSAIIPEELEANVKLGERIRIKLTPPGGPSMRGAAGSAGTRAGKKGKYIPLYDNVMMQAHGTWPIWLSEWIFWDPNMFELSGEVPNDFSMDVVTIALVHRTPVGLSVPGSPKKGVGHWRHDSNEMTVEDEVVARLTLYIEQPFDEGTHEGQHGHDVPLQRGVAGTAF